MDGDKKSVDPLKKGVGKKKKIWSAWYQGESTFDTFQNDPETRPLDQKYLRKGST